MRVIVRRFEPIERLIPLTDIQSIITVVITHNELYFQNFDAFSWSEFCFMTFSKLINIFMTRIGDFVFQYHPG